MLGYKYGGKRRRGERQAPGAGTAKRKKRYAPVAVVALVSDATLTTRVQP